MHSDATTVDAYLEEIDPAKRPMVETLREIVRENLPAGYDEVMRWGMITYEVPTEVSGKTYNGKPLMYVAIGAQKNHVGLYLCGIYCHVPLHDSFVAAYSQAGVKLDMGKACIRMKKPEHILAPAIAQSVAALKPEEYAELCRRD